jgi:hypothetical protein
MEERRFDDLTRALGKATSRRGVLKGLLAGVTAMLAGNAVNPTQSAAAPGGCDANQCMQRAHTAWTDCQARCKAFSCNHWTRTRGQSNCVGCQALCFATYEFTLRDCRETGCFGEEQCCNGTCAFLGNDENNCGACGHACNPGSVCADGQCECDDPKTNCDGHCVDTQSDHENCGSCGHACTGCEICSLGECSSICTDEAPCCNNQCVSTQCDAPKVWDAGSCSCVCPSGNACGNECCTDGQECCNGHCYDRCLDDAPRDPTTCECGCANGEMCGTECCSYIDECCNGNCVTACPPGQRRDSATCQCVCDTGEACGPYCCSENKVCCPDTLTGMSCRDPDANCSGCTYTCGDICCGQYESCCRAADYSYHCVASSGDSC